MHGINVILSSRILPVDAGIGVEYTGLQLAAMSGKLECVKVFIGHGADVNKSRECMGGDWSALSDAISHGQSEVAMYLLEHGAVVKAQKEDQDMLRMAAREGLVEVVRHLVEAGGVDVNGCGESTGGPLESAVGGGHVEVVKYLLGRGADVNGGREHCGYGTPLWRAAEKGQGGFLQLLLDAGAEVNPPDDREYLDSAIESAAENGRLDILHMLLQVHPGGESLHGELEWAEREAEEDGHGEVVRAIREYRKRVCGSPLLEARAVANNSR